MEQLGFHFDQIRNHPLFSGIRQHIVKNFWLYHEANPHVYELFKKFSRQLKLAGRKHYGVGAIIERIRWHFAVESSGDEFKINNNYRSCYARLLMIEDQAFNDFFELRSSPPGEQ